jgi:HK97 family phage portal protein
MVTKVNPLGQFKTAGVAADPTLDRVVRAVGQNSLNHYPNLGAFNEQSRIYSESNYVATAINQIMKAAARVVLNVMIPSGKKRIKSPDHAFEQLLRRPNARQSRYELIASTFGYLMLNGNTYWYAAPDSKGQPAEIIMLRPDRMRIVPGMDTSAPIAGYVYTINGMDIPLDAESVVHWQLFNPGDDYYGLSPLQPLAYSIQTEIGMIKWNRNFFNESRATPAGILSVPSEMNKTDYERLVDDFRRSYGGTSRATAIVRGAVSFSTAGLSHVDMDFLAGRKMTREEVFLAYGVPPGMLDANATEANANAGREYFDDVTMWPLITAFCEKLTAFFGPLYGDNVTIEPEDFRRRDSASERADLIARASYMTINEVRDSLGLPPVDWGDLPASGAGAVAITGQPVDKVNATVKPGEAAITPDDKLAKQQAAAMESGKSAFPAEMHEFMTAIKGILEARRLPIKAAPLLIEAPVQPMRMNRSSRDEVAQFVRYIGKGKPVDAFTFMRAPLSVELACKGWVDAGQDIELLLGYPVVALKAADPRAVAEKQMAENTQGALTSVLQAVIAKIKAVVGDTKADPTDDTADTGDNAGLTEADFEALLDADFWQAQIGIMGDSMAGDIESAVGDAADDTASNIDMRMGISFDKTVFNKLAADYANTWTDGVLKDFGTTTQAGVGSTIARWIATPGATMKDLIDALKQSPAFSAERSRLIAQTEITRAMAVGNHMAADEAADATGVPMAVTQEQVADVIPVHPGCRCDGIEKGIYDDEDRLIGMDMLFVVSHDRDVCDECDANDNKLFSELVDA